MRIAGGRLRASTPRAGEIGAVGVAPAVANAVFHATGLRIREHPILPQRLLAEN
jgi:xanthine dehydrogenase YagR molybdenum-binding subunit